MATGTAVGEIGRLLITQRRTLAVAESLTGGLLAAAFAEGEDASHWFRGGIVAYAADVKRTLLGVPADVPVVSEACARALATNVARLMRADVAIAVTGVGGPDPQDGEPPGTVWLATVVGEQAQARLVRIEGDPRRVCATAVDVAVMAVQEAVGQRPRTPTGR